MRVAALYDIHGNLPALDAVLAEVQTLAVERIVVGGDVLPGPFPRETLERLLAMPIPAQFLSGNGDLAVLAHHGVAPEAVAYWGTTGGAPLPEPFREVIGWTARQLDDRLLDVIRSWPPTVRSTFAGVGDVLFCHGTPRSETESFTRLTPGDRLRPVFDGVAALVVCGHTHMPFDRMIGGTRVVNAGSVGMPFGRTGADWLLLDDAADRWIELRHTAYDLPRAAALVRASGYPQAEDLAVNYILGSPPEAAMLAAFTDLSFPGPA